MAEVLAFRVPAGSAHTLLVWGLEPAPGLEVRLGLGPGPGPPRVPPGLGSEAGTPHGSPRRWGAGSGPPGPPPGAGERGRDPLGPPRGLGAGSDSVEASPYADLRPQSPHQHLATSPIIFPVC